MRPPLLRSSDGAIAGVCVGLAAHLGVPRTWVRIAMVLLTFASGAGVLLYAWLWIFVPLEGASAQGAGRSGPAAFMHDVGASAGGAPRNTTVPDGTTPAGASVIGVPPEWMVRAGRREILLGAGFLVAAIVLGAQLLGVQVQWRALVPIAVVVIGAGLAWSQLDEVRRARFMGQAGADASGGLLRLLAGVVLVGVGVLVAFTGSGSWALTATTLVAVLAVVAGIALVLAPWGLAFWRDLEAERAVRVRETERAEIAAHLHDSVLQTLALIQNRADSGPEVLRLARAQERELRQWLFAPAPGTADSLAERLRAMAGEIEDRYGCAVELVTVGDVAPGAGEDALAQATREAVLNAAKHAGVAVSVYLEVGPDGVEVFVRDRGPGFDPDAVPADRLGIRDSIHRRMQRHGGTSELRSDPDGTEVRLRMPRRADPEA